MIIGMREETEKKAVVATTGEAPLLDRDESDEGEAFRDEDESDNQVELGIVNNNGGESSDEDAVLR